MSVYEGQSLRGSGIYGYEIKVSFACEYEIYAEDGFTTLGYCDFNGDADGYVDDFGTVSGNCPKCGEVKELYEIDDDQRY
jgi:hypothetical protein